MSELVCVAVPGMTLTDHDGHPCSPLPKGR